MKNLICVMFSLVTVLTLVSCTTGTMGTEGLPKIGEEDVNGSAEDHNLGIEYWTHTITAAEVYYTSGNPYGYYDMVCYDSRFSGDYWFDVWFVMVDGSWSRMAPFYDDVIGTWYMVIYLYYDSLEFRSPSDLTGLTMVIFRAEANEAASYGAKSSEKFDASKYFETWPPVGGLDLNL